VAGAAALLAQMRPDLDGGGLAGLLAGYAQRGHAVPTAVGGGLLRLGASAVGELASTPTSIGFGIWEGSHWHATRFLTIRNVSSRRLEVSANAITDGDSEALKFKLTPKQFVVRAGHARRVKVTVRAPAAADTRLVTGTIDLRAAGHTMRVPWAMLFRGDTANLLGSATISAKSFAPSDTDPAILSVQAGALVRDGGLQIEPVRRLDILLYNGSGKFLGVMARLRDLLPGSYSFGITGRGPTSTRLPRGAYELRLAAWPTLPLDAKPQRLQVSFQLD
jgi:hypothetical protein